MKENREKRKIKATMKGNWKVEEQGKEMP